MNLNRLLLLLTFAIIGYGAFDLLSTDPASVGSNELPDGYLDATGRQVSLKDFAGEYLWVDYAAEWCGYCGPQTGILKDLDAEMGDEIRFLTVVTGTGKVMALPSAETAMNWARRYGLEPRNVLARFSTNTLPYHILYSPTGETLFQSSGFLQAAQIRRILNDHLSL